MIIQPIGFLKLISTNLKCSCIKPMEKENHLKTLEEQEENVHKEIKKLDLKLDMNRIDQEKDSEMNTSKSARPRIKTPRNPLNNVLLSPRKELYTSPREEITKFLSKRQDLELQGENGKKIFIDETEDEMLLRMKNQDVELPKKSKTERRRSYHKEGEISHHFQQL